MPDNQNRSTVLDALESTVASVPGIPGNRPFLKWAGGKRQLLDTLLPRCPTEIGTYFEPFLGSGALFFALAPRKAVLADANEELICAFVAVRDQVEEVIDILEKHVNNKSHFDAVRAADPSQLNTAERAARVIYLNRTCFNGLYRVNRSGKFNTPFGGYENPTICNATHLRATSSVLAGRRILSGNYLETLRPASSGDFVYLDPPYVPVSQYSDFRRYHHVPFGENEHRQLFAEMCRLHEVGCFVMTSNSDCEFTRDLYQAPWRVTSVNARRAINRSAIKELIVTNY